MTPCQVELGLITDIVPEDPLWGTQIIPQMDFVLNT